MRKVKIKITSQWNVPPNNKYKVNDEYKAVLKPCTDGSGNYYAVLDDGSIIPNGNFDVTNQKAKPKTGNTNFTKEFSQGYACALVCMINSHGIETPISEAWRANFGSKQTMQSLKKLDIHEYDLETIKIHLKELNGRQD